MTSQGAFDEGFGFHRRALQLYKSTLGTRHHRTADVFVKVAEHHSRMSQWETATILLDHALGIYSTAPHFMPERARASFRKAKAHQMLGKLEYADEEREKCFEWYNMLYDQLVQSSKAKEKDRKGFEDLCDADFDNMVSFWSR